MNPPIAALFATTINPVSVCFNIFRWFVYLPDLTSLWVHCACVGNRYFLCAWFFIWTFVHNRDGCFWLFLWPIWIKTSAISFSFWVVVSFQGVCQAFPFLLCRDEINIYFTLGQVFYFFPFIDQGFTTWLICITLFPSLSFICWVYIKPSAVKCIIFLFLTALSGFC